MVMNSKKLNAMIKVIAAAVIALSAGMVNGAEKGVVDANGLSGQMGVTQTSLAYGPAIHSYRGAASVEQATVNPIVTYVSLAYGPALYSYPRAGQDTVAAFNVQYVNSALGPAIYSYPYPQFKQPVFLLRLQPL